MDIEHPRPSFRFRDKFSRLKDRVKEKIRDKAIKHNVTMFIHQNLTSNDTHDDYSSSHHHHRHGFRERMHHMKDVLKNKTHYESFKHKIEDKLDLYDNKTYPKGFYDSLFSPENENDVYLQTALICLWCLALLCIIPTIIIIFLPSRKKNRTLTSANMIFFHIFICELCYLSYILLAMINVKKNFHLGQTLCDYANYGMYVTIPIMQFALLFLSLERLSSHFKLSMTWSKIFSKAYLIQLILCAIWIFLIAAVLTFTFIKKQFNFSFVKDQIKHAVPTILGDVTKKIASRRYHCSIDGRLSSVFKTLIIVLFIVLIVKPIILSIGFNLLTPYCCRNRRRDKETQGDRRTTNLVTIFLLLNFFFSFPFYLISMFKSIFTSIDVTKDTFLLILKICFILRITNIIFECLAFYIFERNSWSLLSKIFYYGTCKKFAIFKAKSDDDSLYTKNRKVTKVINHIRTGEDVDDDDDDDDDDVEAARKKRTKQKLKKKGTSMTRTEVDDDDDDGAFVKRKSNADKEKPATKKRTSKQITDDDDDNNQTKKITHSRRKPSIKETASDETEEETKKVTTKPKRKSSVKQTETDEDDEQETKKVTTKAKRKSSVKQIESDEDDDDEEEIKKVTTKNKRKTSKKKPESDEEDTTTRRKSSKKPSDDEESETDIIRTKRKSLRKQSEYEQDDHGINNSKHKIRLNLQENEEFIPKTKSKPHPQYDDESHTSDDTPITTRKHSSSISKRPERRLTPPLVKSESDTISNPSPSPEPPRRSSTNKSGPSNTRSRTKSPTSRVKRISKKKSHSSSKKLSYTSTKKPKKDHQTRILEMSDDV